MVTYISLFRVYICNHFVEYMNKGLLQLLPAFVGEISSHEDEGY